MKRNIKQENKIIKVAKSKMESMVIDHMNNHPSNYEHYLSAVEFKFRFSWFCEEDLNDYLYGDMVYYVWPFFYDWNNDAAFRQGLKIITKFLDAIQECQGNEWAMTVANAHYDELNRSARNQVDRWNETHCGTVKNPDTKKQSSLMVA